MLLQLQVEVEVAAAAGAGLQVALALEPQAAAVLHTGRNAHLHPLVVDGQGALGAAESIGKGEADAGFGIEIDRGAAAASGHAASTAAREA
jgi:hypothetical protein